jgi:hypothetical protein
MIRLIFFVFLIALSNTCFSQQEDLALIYAIGINKRLQDFKKNKTLIIDSTDHYETGYLKQLFRMGFKLKRFDSSWIGAYQNFDTAIIDIHKYFTNSPNIITLSGKKKQLILNNNSDNFWDVLYKKYPAYSGVTFASPVYFNNNFTEAIFCFSLIYSKCGNGAREACHLIKDNFGKWILLDRF